MYYLQTIIIMMWVLLLSSAASLLNAQDTPDGKIIYPHNVFWSKTELNQLDKNFRWGLGLDFVYRRKSGLVDKSMFAEPLRESLRPWVHYQFSPYARLSISPLGYMNTNEYIGKPEDVIRPSYHEWRTTFQFFHHQKSLNGKWMHTWRYRYELRWQEIPGTDDYRYLSRFRFRYRIRYVLTGNDFYQDKTWYTAVSNEIGLNLGKNVLYNTFNQNRLYVGVGYRFFNALRVEARYVDRFRTRGATGIEFDHGRGFMLGMYVDNLTSVGKGEQYKVRFTD
ncbi:MAG TPA: DUF2490 domain-containing protein [Saprospiraceae bacterium]|nr:DUF2490 domain-containing protein [Saprospiraceae bacterium]HMP22930.1 DUF2490 domain-containing protein [Saprospiraceae bacterium]